MKIENIKKDELHGIEVKEPPVREKVLYWVGLSVLAITLITLATYLYWIVAPYDPLVFQEKNKDGTEAKLIKIANEGRVVENGGYVELKLNFCKTIDTPGEVQAFLADTVIVQLDWPNDTGKKQCVKGILPFKLPKFANLDPRHIEFNVTYHVNPIKTVIEEFRTEEFTFKQ